MINLGAYIHTKLFKGPNEKTVVTLIFIQLLKMEIKLDSELII